MAERFKTIDDVIKEINRCYPNFETTYDGLETNVQRIEYVASIIGMLPKVIPDFTKRMGKSSGTAIFHRERGNYFLGINDISLAHKNYTKSIARSPPDSEDIALAYGNRSLILFTMNHIEECMDDINRAMEAGFPQDRIFKLHKRRGQCFFKMGNFEEAISRYGLAKESLSISILSREKRNKFFLELVKLTKEATSQENRDTNVPFRSVSDYHVVVPEISYGPNPEIEGASKCIKLEQDDKLGLHFVATRDINAGDVLVSTDTFATYLFLGKTITHCYACMQRCDALIPCSTCCYVMFCSKECWEQNKENHLKFECIFLAQITHFGINVCSFLAYKTIIRAGFQKSLEEYQHWKEFQNQDLRTSVLTDGRFVVNVRAIFNVHTFNKLNLTLQFGDSPVNGLKYIIRAHALLPVFKTFVDNPNQFLPVIFFLALCDFKDSVPMLDVRNMPDLNRDLLGTAYTMPITLTQHSCCSNSEWITYGTKAVNYATSFIREGSRISSTRVGNYTEITKMSRHIYANAMLDFTCECQACTENWPTLSDETFPEMPIYLDPENLSLCLDSYETVKDLFPEDGITNLISSNDDAARVANYLTVSTRVGGHRCMKFASFRNWLLFFWRRKGNLYYQKYL